MFSLLTTKQGLLILLCGVTQIVSAQSITTDSLYNLPFDDMDRVFKTLSKTEQEQLAQAYLEKAKQENENYKKANGYYLHSFLASFTKPAVQYADSIIQVSQNVEQYPYPGLGYLQKGIELYYINKTQESLDNYIKSNAYFSEVDDTFNLLRVQHYIALLKNKIDRPQEALPIFKKNMEFFEKEEYQEKYRNQYFKSLFALADSYNRNRHSYDNAEKIIIEGIEKSFAANDQMYPNFLFIYGATKILKEEFASAIDSIIKGNKLIEDKRNIASNYIDISFLYGKTNNEKLAIKYLLKVDSMYPKNQETIKYAHEANEFLYKDYGKYFEIEQRLEIVNKF